MTCQPPAPVGADLDRRGRHQLLGQRAQVQPQPLHRGWGSSPPATPGRARRAQHRRSSCRPRSAPSAAAAAACRRTRRGSAATATDPHASDPPSPSPSSRLRSSCRRRRGHRFSGAPRWRSPPAARPGSCPRCPPRWPATTVAAHQHRPGRARPSAGPGSAASTDAPSWRPRTAPTPRPAPDPTPTPSSPALTPSRHSPSPSTGNRRATTATRQCAPYRRPPTNPRSLCAQHYHRANRLRLTAPSSTASPPPRCGRCTTAAARPSAPMG